MRPGSSVKLHAAVKRRATFISCLISEESCVKGINPCVKQRVLKKSGGVKRRKAFKGTPKHRKGAENAAKRRRVEITFVGEDDLVSEQIPEPLASVSSRKLQQSDGESTSDESISAEMPVAEGYRFLDIESFREFVERIHSVSQHCASGKLKVKNLN